MSTKAQLSWIRGQEVADLNSTIGTVLYYIHIHDTSFELSVFWPSDTESRINELRFSDSISQSLKRRLTSVTCFAATLLKVNFKHGTSYGKNDEVT